MRNPLKNEMPIGASFEGYAFGIVPIWASDAGDDIEIYEKYFGTGWMIDTIGFLYATFRPNARFLFILREI